MNSFIDILAAARAASGCPAAAYALVPEAVTTFSTGSRAAGAVLIVPNGSPETAESIPPDPAPFSRMISGSRGTRSDGSDCIPNLRRAKRFPYSTAISGCLKYRLTTLRPEKKPS